MIQKVSLHQFMIRIITAGAWLALLTFAVLFSWSWSTSGIAFDIVRLDLDAPAKLQKLRHFFAECGHFAPVVYFAMETIEVIIAPIPGLMLYAPGGAIFGPALGGTLSLAGNIIGHCFLRGWLHTHPDHNRHVGDLRWHGTALLCSSMVSGKSLGNLPQLALRTRRWPRRIRPRRSIRDIPFRATNEFFSP